MQVHHRFDVERVSADVVNDGVGKAVEVELAIVAPEFPPTPRLGHNAEEGASKLVKEVTAQAGQPLLVPTRGRFQFLGFVADLGDDAVWDTTRPMGNERFQIELS